MRRIVLILVALALGSYLVWDRVEARRLAKAIAAIAARGEPVRYDDNLPAPKTPEQVESAGVYAQAAELAYQRDLDENRRASRLDLDAPGGTEIPIDDIRANYSGQDSALPLLDRATPMDFGGFTSEERGDERSARSPLELGLTSLGSFACLRADLASISGDADTAVQALVPCVRLQRTLSFPSSRSVHSVRILGSVRILFRHTQPSDAALATLQQAFDSWPAEDTSLKSTQLNRVSAIEMMTGQPFAGLGFSIARVLFHPMWMASARRALSAFDEPIANAQRPWAERWPIAERRQRETLQAVIRQRSAGWSTRLTDPFAAPFVWTTTWIRQAAYDLAAQRIAALTLTIERYRRAHDGSLPPSVSAPEDPFSGRPLIYRKDADGYAIYSVDENRKDDRGILYGFGAAGLRNVGQQTPRDFGIHVLLKME